jgi:hypothetical protein
VAELARALAVRRAALQRLGENAVRRGAPLATIEETLVPLYLHHRYQTEAAVKLVGGVTYTYALRGDGQTPLGPVPAAAQLTALDAVLATLDPAALALPRGLLATIPPRPYTYESHRELFDRWTGLTFDAVSPAAAAAGMSVALRVELRGESGAIEPALKQLPGVERVSVRGERDGFTAFEVEARPDADVREAVFRLAVSGRWALRELSSQGASLEDIFIHLTTQELAS